MASKRRRGKVQISGDYLSQLLFKTGVIKLSGIKHDKDRDVYHFYFDTEDESVIEIPEGSDCRAYKLNVMQDYFGKVG